MRHAQPESSLLRQPDSRRTLTALGIRQVGQTVGKIPAEEPSGITVIEHSPLVRARQTAEIAAQRLNSPVPLKPCDNILPDDDPRLVAPELAASENDRFLVGHNFHVEKLARLLLGKKAAGKDLTFAHADLLILERTAPPSAGAPLGDWTPVRFLSPDERSA